MAGEQSGGSRDNFIWLDAMCLFLLAVAASGSMN